MALRPDLDRLSHHWRHPERVRRAAGVALTAAWELNSKCRRGSRKGIGNVDLSSADPDQIVVVQCDQGIVDRLRRAVGRGRDKVLDRNRPSSLKECPEDQPNERFL